MDKEKQIKILERNIERLKTSPNWPSSESWRQLIIWDQEEKLEELRGDLS